MSVPTSIQVAKTTVGELDVCEITTGDVDGTGIFDTLMRSVNSHLTEQFEKGRISGSDFASVYTAAITATLDQAIKLAAEKQLLPYEIMIKEREILKQDYELNELLPKQNEKLEKENLLLDAQKSELDYRLSNTLPVEKANLEFTGANLQAENALLVSKLTTETKQQSSIDAQIATTNAQTELYEQKTTSELAQVDGTVIIPNSVLDYQNKLIKAQTDAFTTDAIQKSTKLLIDTWNVRHNNESNGNPPDGFNKLHDKNIGEAVTMLMESAGMTPQTYP